MKREIHTWSTICLTAGSALCHSTFDGALLVTSGCWLGLLLHPDLDLGDTPYGKVRKHRGLSHWPIVGTIDRLLWFCLPLLLALAVLRVDWGSLALMGAGLVLSDLLHIGLDVLDAALVKRGVNL